MAGIKGHLILNVEEASGRNKDNQYIWDFQDFLGWVKVELRGGPTNVKVQTTPKEIVGTSISWKQELQLEVAEGANELRLMLCKEKVSPDGRKGVSVIAACGIFVKDILDNVPIDKYFELFKPNAGGEGGFIRIGIDFRPKDSGSSAPAAVEQPANGEVARSVPAKIVKATKKSGGGGGVLKIVLPIVVVAAGVFGFLQVKKRSDKKEE